MIVKFGCKNIKAIKAYEDIEIKPITIIMGENSSGKSSMLQALSLLNVNKTFGNNIQKIKYNNPFSQLGNTDSFKNKNDEVIFSFKITERNTILKLIYIDDEVDSQYGILKRVDIDNDDMDVSLELDNSESLEYKLNIVNIKNTEDINKLINHLEVYTNLRLITKMHYLPDASIDTKHTVNSNLNKIQESTRFILKPLEILLDNLAAIRHVGMIKEKNETYDYGLDYIGYFGEKYKDRALGLESTKFLEEAISHIFDYGLVVDKTKQELFLEVENKKLQLHMFGSSINSTIPILTQFAQNREESIKNKYRLTIIEEPELNLHPQSQARFVEALFKDDIPARHYTILETHSDHILNKIRFLVSKKILKSEDVVVYYKQKNSKFQKININECGTFAPNFPKGFYDATLEDIYALGEDC